MQTRQALRDPSELGKVVAAIRLPLLWRKYTDAYFERLRVGQGENLHVQAGERKDPTGDKVADNEKVVELLERSASALETLLGCQRELVRLLPEPTSGMHRRDRRRGARPPAMNGRVR